MTLSPFVYWAQSEENVFLKIDLKDVKDPQVFLKKENLQFQSKGIGAQGYKDYEFHIHFFSNVNDDGSIVKITDHKVDLTLTKVEKAWWPRLTSQPQKPAWLKIDFDRWQSEDDLLEENVKDIREDYPDLFQQLQKEEMGYKTEDFRKVYLTLYNLFMYVGFMYIVCVLVIKYLSDGTKFFSLAYETVGHVVCFLQLLQFLEILHPLIGYVKGRVLMPLMQIIGRGFVLFFLLEQIPYVQDLPVVYFLFLTWSAVEIIRYPYYISQLYKREYVVLTWLRYNIWTVLYPVGFVCEAIIVYISIMHLELPMDHPVYSSSYIKSPFYFTTVLKIYLLVIFFPGTYFLMSHMKKARDEKYGKKSQKLKKS